MITMISSTANYVTYSEPIKDFRERMKAEKPFSDAKKQADELLAKESAKKMLATIQSDSQFAEQMANTHAFTRDYELIDLADVPIESETGMNEYSQHVRNFEAKANDVMTERIQLYNKMKTNGSTGAEIFNGLVAFDKTLSADYQKATKLDLMTNLV